MPSKGGLSDKYGNRYEGFWTVFCMFKVIDERADFIHLEPSGLKDDGVEFYLSKNDKKEFYQVKRQNTLGKWTLADLNSNNILSNFWSKIKNNEKCYFISTYSTYELDELSDRSRMEETFVDFIQNISSSDKLQTSFSNLCQKYWKCSENEAYESLKLIWVKSIDENSLIEMVEFSLYTLVKGDSATVKDIFAQFALEKVGEKLNASAIWRHLEERGFERRDFSNDEHILKIISDNNKIYMDYLNRKLINNEIIIKNEAEESLELLLSENSSDILLLGKAGIGKSNVILQIMSNLDEKNIPFIVLRLDRLKTFTSPKNIGLELELPESPAKVLGAVTNGSKGVLIIDQMDAISLISGRHPSFFDCIYELIRQIKIYPNLRIVLGCREFDLNYDFRFKKLKDDINAKILNINPLSRHEIEKIIETMRLDKNKFNKNQFNLLSLPLNLKLLKEIVDDPSFSKDSDFDIINFNVLDLYDKFWEYKEERINSESNFRVRWTEVIDKLCNYMNNNQVLSTPKVIVDDFAPDARLMAYEQVLTLENNHYSFFHEEFFDYAFARRFASKEINLVSFIKEYEQDLFKRTQIRQILTYERENNYFKYIENINGLLHDPAIRFHIKEATLAVISKNENINDEECRLIISLTNDPSNKLFNKIGAILKGSNFWFEKIDSQNLFEKWLASDDEKYINFAIWLFYGFMDNYPDRIAELIESYVGISEDWNNRIIHLIRFADLNKGDDLYLLFLTLIDKGILDDKQNNNYESQLWNSIQYSIIKKLSENNPERGICILYHYLKRRFNISNPHPNPFDYKFGCIPKTQLKREIILSLAKNNSEKFVEFLLPFMLESMEINKINSDVPFLDNIWLRKRFGKSMFSNEIILESMVFALKNLSKEDPYTFKINEKNLSISNFKTAQFLLLHAYSANGKEFVDNAVNYLITHESSITTGYIDNSYWITRELVKSIRPFCSNNQLRDIESVFLDYYDIDYFNKVIKWISTFYPLYENKIREYHLMKCEVQFGLLDATPSYNRSKIVSSTIKKLKKELNRDSPTPPNVFEATFVPSPISAEKAEIMEDEDWLDAIQKYNEEEFSFEGGALELSRTLEKEVKKNPDRFSQLIFDFPNDTNPFYFKAVLDGIKDSNLDIAQIISVCEYCHKLPEKPYGKEICDVIGSLAEKSLPDRALKLIVWYMLNDQDPVKEYWDGDSDEDIFFNGDMFDAGINSIRGNAAFNIYKLIYNDSNRISYFEPIFNKMVKDPSIAVKSCIVLVLEAIYVYDKDLAKNLLYKLYNIYDTENEILLSSRPIERFFYRIIVDEFEDILPVLTKMILSDFINVAALGAKLIAFCSLISEQELPMLRYCLYNSEIQRKNVAKVFASNISYSSISLIKKILVPLFDDPSIEVQREASMCFSKLESNFTNYIDLIDLFIDSKAFIENYIWLFHAFKKNILLPDITTKACEKFFEVTCEDSGDLRTSAAGDVKEVIILILNIYNQTNKKDLKRRCLDLIDYMLEIDAYNIENILSEYERKKM